jgi:hypothetical protein
MIDGLFEFSSSIRVILNDGLRGGKISNGFILDVHIWGERAAVGSVKK